jgi:nicotinamidase/pyrazinamidase
MRELRVFFDIDTQVDFMRPTGALAVPGAEQIIPNLQRLMDWARQNDEPVISTADVHSLDDPEFRIWPPHCVSGTPGQQRIPETLFPAQIVIPRRPGAFRPPERWVGQFIVEKAAYSPEDNPNFDAILRSLDPRRAVVFGVVTEYCVRASALALRQRGFPVDIVTDAIRPIAEVSGCEALEEMLSAGVRRITTLEACRHSA